MYIHTYNMQIYIYVCFRAYILYFPLVELISWIVITKNGVTSSYKGKLWRVYLIDCAFFSFLHLKTDIWNLDFSSQHYYLNKFQILVSPFLYKFFFPSKQQWMCHVRKLSSSMNQNGLIFVRKQLLWGPVNLSLRSRP